MFADIDGARIWYERHGAGMPMLLLHGGLGLDHSYFRPYLDPLGDRVELIHYDHRGNGRSSPVDDWSQVDTATFADDAEALRVALGLGDVLVLGHSFGAVVGLDYALRYGDHLRGLALCAGAPSFDYPDVVMARFEERATPAQKQAFAAAQTAPPTTDAAFRGFLDTMISSYFDTADPADVARMLAAIKLSVGAYARGMELLPALDFRAHLGDITVPTLILAGANDWFFPVAEAAEPLARIPDSELVVFPHSGHLPFIDETDDFLATVRRWLGRLPPSP